MPILRKIDRPDDWDLDLDFAPFVLEAMIARIAGDDRVGLTRVDRPGNAGGEHSWRGRVYHGDSETHRQFADAAHDGTEAALCAAVVWRDAERAKIPPRTRTQPGRTWRIARAEYGRNCGWLAYADKRRYFADGKYGGVDAAKRVAEAWMEQRRSAASA